MAHHFVTVCVFCVLCAAHTPCYAHMDAAFIVKQGPRSAKYSTDSPDFSEHLFSRTDSVIQESEDIKNVKNHKHLSKKVPDENIQKSHYGDTLETEDSKPTRQTEHIERLDHGALDLLKNVNANDNNGENLRLKRSSKLNTKYFNKKILEHYGNGEHMTMEAFEKLLRDMGLFQSELKVSEQKLHSTDSSQSSNQLDVAKEQNNKDLQGAITHVDPKERCLSSRELLSALSGDETYKTANKNGTIPGWLLESVWPALVYQLVAVSASERGGCVHVLEKDYVLSESGHHELETMTGNVLQVWVYSFLSILVISLCGLLSVAVIPVMGKSYYNQLLQFLVALAIGSLCGDAFIHLLPHSMSGEQQHDHSHSHEVSQSHLHVDRSEITHNLNMWKGLVVVLGVVLFFFVEKALNIISEWKKYRENRKKMTSRVRVMRESDTGNSNTVGEKLCKHKYSTYPYCYGEIATEAQDNLHSHQHNHHERPQTIEEEKPLTCNSTNCNSVSNKIMQNDIEKKNNDDWKLDETVITNTKKAVDGSDVPLNDTESYTVIIRDHDAKHHGHGHTHNHVHSTPDSMSSVAWMVVMGDGLHNFTDGMAIGAAFCASIPGGFSTSLAVFCHELPHELGDFAVLLKAGMNAKQAIFYNLLSSILCLVGMICGILIGTTPDSIQWIFALTSGIFVYIALVDMIPELSSNHSVIKGAHWNCIIQGAGLSCGFITMLIIALYEHDLQNLFSG